MNCPDSPPTYFADPRDHRSVMSGGFLNHTTPVPGPELREHATISQPQTGATVCAAAAYYEGDWALS